MCVCVFVCVCVLACVCVCVFVSCNYLCNLCLLVSSFLHTVFSLVVEQIRCVETTRQEFNDFGACLFSWDQFSQFTTGAFASLCHLPGATIFCKKQLLISIRLRVCAFVGPSQVIFKQRKSRFLKQITQKTRIQWITVKKPHLSTLSYLWLR